MIEGTSSWKERLKNLFGGLGQDPLEDVILQMDLTSTEEERSIWLETLDSATAAALREDPAVVEIVNSGGGYLISTPLQALGLFHEIRELYLKEVALAGGPRLNLD